MTKIHSYLTFNGNCREAMTFYRDCLGGELVFQTIDGSPLTDPLPAPMKPYILHATLTRGKWRIMGSDMVPDHGLVKGNAVSLLLECSSEKEILTCYNRLSDGGIASHPLATGYWGALFGDLTDKFGNQWLLHCNKKQTPAKTKGK